MHWRRRRIQPDMECDLGPVIGPIAPMRPVTYRRTPFGLSWAERGTARFIGVAAMSAWLILVAMLVASLITAAPVKAQNCETGRFQGLSALARSLNVKPSQATTPNIMVATDCDGRTYDVLAIMQAMVDEMKKGKR